MPLSIFPEPTELRDLDKETFNFLQTDSVFARESDLRGRACSAFDSISGNGSYSFDAAFNAEIEGRKDRKVYVSSKVICTDDTYKDISHCFALCECGNVPLILRKVHFDITFSEPSPGDFHPVYHFQLDGKLTKKMKDDGCDDSRLSSAISVPRWPCQPISAALFFDVVFRELGNSNLRSVVGSSGWKKIVVANEKVILHPYYEFASQQISSAVKRPFVDSLYGMG